ncbi:hypothetical protein [Acetobacteroides hydrogenigenes]|uniref:Uncharacterized protein n=1 Tax=Acetobacteroides hydrogenigenes TaxID=979970 RepID=A0A4R2F6V9_9BACT|nr:hypothetical protein [Acetobacteroides hydrogenigenes]TCN72980.1 hypothetical protein CLV25_101198 [Acetobacteroides hydrogenigenes]
MPLNDLICITFSDDEKKAIDNALATLEQVLEGKVVNLTPLQRKKYSRVKYNMEGWVNRSSSFLYNNPHLIPSYVDASKLKLDLEAHGYLNPLIDKMSLILQGLTDTNLLLGTDIYNACMGFYRSVKVAYRGNAAGSSAIYEELKKQFPGGRKKKVEE